MTRVGTTRVGTTRVGAADSGTREVPAGAAALAKGLSLLDLVADAERPLPFSELLRRSGLSKPTFARILRTLAAYGLIRQDERRGTYALGPRFMELTHRVWDTFDLSAAARPELQALSVDLGETVALCALDSDSVRYVDQASGDGLGVRVEAGRRAPLHATAAGKALLAFQDPATLRGIASRMEFHRFTDATIPDVGRLEAELTLTRARGYAVSLQEHLADVNSVAVVVAGKDGLPLGAIAALGPATRLDETAIHPVGRELIAAARRITGSVGAVAITSRPRPRLRPGGASAPVECVLPWGAQLGEAAVWHGEERRLYWVDILKPAVCRYDPATGRNENRDLGKIVSAAIPAECGRLVLATQDGLEWFDFETGALELLVHPEAGIDGNRLNDAKAGPGGAIWIGSMRTDASRPTGALYRVSGDGSVEVKETGISVSNGLGWAPDGRTFYFVDTVPGTIYAYDAEPGSGNLRNRRVFARVPEVEGRPDGICVDAEGGVWVAIWDGWRVDRYHPDGRKDRSLEMPVPRPTSVAFGGPDLDTLYVTSARTRLPASTLAEAPLSGGLFACRPGETATAGTLFRSAQA